MSAWAVYVTLSAICGCSGQAPQSTGLDEVQSAASGSTGARRMGQRTRCRTARRLAPPDSSLSVEPFTRGSATVRVAREPRSVPGVHRRLASQSASERSA